MKRFLQTGKNSSIGLDIGRNSIKAVQLHKRDDGKIALLAYGRKNLNTNKNVDSILHPPHYLAALHSILQSPNYGEFSGRNFALALPNRHTYVQYNVSADEFVQQANQALGTTVDELIINTYRKTPTLAVSIASVQTIITPHFNALSNIGSVTNSDHELSAAIRTLKNLNNQPTLIVDIGSNDSGIGIYNSMLMATQKVDFGIHTFCDYLAKKLNISYDEAGELLFNFGFLPSSVQLNIREASKVVMQPLIKSLLTNIETYNIGRVVLCGGGASIPCVAQYIQENSNVKTIIIDPWDRIGKYPLKPIPKKIAPIFATAVGLALLDLE